MKLRMVWVALLAVAVVGSGTVLGGPAQDVLADLARSERSARIAGGVAAIGVGVAVGVGSAVLLAGSGIEVYGMLTGALIALPGVGMLIVPTAAEREYVTAGASETESALALERLAVTGRRERIISGIANAATGIAALLYPFGYVTPYDYVYAAVTSFGMAAVDFLLPSKEERAFETYQRLAGQGV